MSRTSSNSRVGCLDGLRGIAALWVLIGHAHLLSGWHVPIIGDPDLGVDLFVMLSGFLMVFHYQLRKDREPWENWLTWRLFWTRRFFRIAPLYYVMLAIALALGPILYDARIAIDTFNGVRLQAESRYLDDSIVNYLSHLSFLFGLIPQYAYRTPLPDWSIGLEMQFYAALPFLMIIIGRAGWFKGMIGIVVCGAMIALLTKMVGIRFPMPSFLPLKMHVFAAGMLLAGPMGSDRKAALLAFSVAALLILVPIGGETDLLHGAVRLSIVALFFSLIHATFLPAGLSKVAVPASKFLGNRFFHNLGELSFGAYLIHLLVMQPVIAQLIKYYGTEMSDPARWAASLVITLPVVYGFAWAGYNLIEIQGQKIGRALTRAPAPAAA